MHLRQFFLFLGFFILGIFFLLRTTPFFFPRFISIKIENSEILAEVAKTPSERARGLSRREQLPKNQGMLFIFPYPQRVSFWMKEMNFPIDLIFIDENCTIIEAFSNLSPHSFPQTFTPKEPIKYALEVNSGFVESHKIRVGSKVKINRGSDLLQCK